MKLVALLAAGFVGLSAPALAQYIPRPMAPIGPPSAQDAIEIVEAMGLRPIGMPVRNGPFYVQGARDDLGRVLRVTVDARRSQVVAVETGAPRGFYGRYAGYAPHHRPAPYPLEDFDIAPSGPIVGSRTMPDGTLPYPVMPQAMPKPSVKSATVTPKEPPVPRKRPASAPQQTAGSIAPVVAPASTAPAAEKPAAVTPEPPANAMPPVNSLE